jgi:hypothetical protein
MGGLEKDLLMQILCKTPSGESTGSFSNLRTRPAMVRNKQVQPLLHASSITCMLFPERITHGLKMSLGFRLIGWGPGFGERTNCPIIVCYLT